MSNIVPRSEHTAAIARLLNSDGSIEVNNTIDPNWKVPQFDTFTQSIETYLSCVVCSQQSQEVGDDRVMAFRRESQQVAGRTIEALEINSAAEKEAIGRATAKFQALMLEWGELWRTIVSDMSSQPSKTVELLLQLETDIIAEGLMPQIGRIVWAIAARQFPDVSQFPEDERLVNIKGLIGWLADEEHIRRQKSC